MQQLLCASCGAVVATAPGDFRPHSWEPGRLCPVCFKRDEAARVQAAVAAEETA